MLVVFWHVQMHELRARFDHGLHSGEIACTDGIDEPTDSGPIDERLELRPAIEAVGASENELCVVQRKTRQTGSLVMSVHFLCRVGVSIPKRLEQLLGLSLELIEVGVIGKRTGGY